MGLGGGRRQAGMAVAEPLVGPVGQDRLAGQVVLVAGDRLGAVAASLIGAARHERGLGQAPVVGIVLHEGVPGVGGGQVVAI
jgi:hypothetical protein